MKVHQHFESILDQIFMFIGQQLFRVCRWKNVRGRRTAIDGEPNSEAE